MISPVLVTPPAEPVVSTDEAKAQCRVTHTDDDTLIAGYVAAAISLLDGWSGILGRCLVTQSWRVDRAEWSGAIRLPFPNCSNVVVKYSDTSDVEQTVSTSLYQVYEDSRSTLVWFRKAFTSPSLYDDRVDPIRISFDAGYGDAEDVPEAIKQAIKLLVGHWYENREEVIIGSGVDLRQLPLAFKTLISPFRRLPIDF